MELELRRAERTLAGAVAEALADLEWATAERNRLSAGEAERYPGLLDGPEGIGQQYFVS